MRFHFTLSSPTFINLASSLQKKGWKSTSQLWLSHFNEQHFQFDLLAAQTLEYKQELMKLVNRFCPEVMPITLGINDQNWVSVLNQLARENLDCPWILKPSMLNNGQHIKIFKHLEDIEQHYLSPNRMGGEHVIQGYIMHPHLIQGPKQGHKYSIRVFVVWSNYGGIYVYPKGYYNIALHPYNSEFNDLRPHLTNEHLSHENLNVVQIPTTKYELFAKDLYIKIKVIISKITKGLEQVHPQAFTGTKRKLAIFGFDFLVDEDLQVYLLETNHAPCFPVSEDHPLQNVLYKEFWESFISSFVVPIAQKQRVEEIEHVIFEKI